MFEIILWVYLISVIISFVGLLWFRESKAPIDTIDIIVASSICVIPGINVASLIGVIFY